VGADQDRYGRPGELGHVAPAGAAVFTKEGEYWTISSDGAVFRLRESRGLGFVARLIAEPGTRFHASVLARAGDRQEGDQRLAERDRVNVTKSIKAAVRKIAEHHRTLAVHLQSSIKTGAYCAYLPSEVGPKPRSATEADR
jgi:hypothetical protein